MNRNDHFNSLASHLNLWIMPLGAAIFIAVLGANYLLSKHLLEEYIADLAEATASSTVRSIETIFNTVATSADTLSATVSSSDFSDRQIHQTIKTFIDTNTSIFGMTVALEPHTLVETLGEYSPYYYRYDNKLVFTDLTDSRYNYKTQPWYTRAKQAMAPIWSEPYFDEGGADVQMITYSTPIYLPDGKTFAGITTADIRLSQLDEIIREMKIGESGYGFILSRNDVLIAHSDEAINLTKLTKDQVAPDKWQRYIDSKKQSTAVHFRSPCSRKTEEGNCWFTIQSLNDIGWKIVIVLPEKELTAKVNT
ncbi:MAG: Cache 3/Cache 2 fusion domain-containing protein, partial [Gammaproteobacteria bacterium]|nr:Cache 3/Cache 2 fusion domain-containing protein [Gammaproteobacteria bacterium]